MATLKRKQILVIEDHDSIRMLLDNILNKNYSVITRSDGLEGMAWLGEGNIPDLILLDRQMPRINGDDFLRGIRTSGLFKNIPVIMVSGTDEQQEIEECMAIGANDFLTKPFDPGKLNAKIGALIGPINNNVN